MWKNTKKVLDEVQNARISVKRVLYRMIYELCHFWKSDFEDPDCNYDDTAITDQRFKYRSRYYEGIQYAPTYDVWNCKKAVLSDKAIIRLTGPFPMENSEE